MATQRPWQSRTMWINLLSGIAAVSVVFGFDFGLDETKQTEIVAGIMAVVNVVNMYLRPVSTTPITMKAPDEGEPPTGI